MTYFNIQTAQETGQPLSEIRTQVDSYISEIEHKQGGLSIPVMLMFVTKILSRIVEEISYNKSGISEVMID